MTDGDSGRDDVDSTGDDRDDKARIAQGDTFAWLFAAVQVVGPVLLVLLAIVAIGWGIIALLFF